MRYCGPTRHETRRSMMARGGFPGGRNMGGMGGMNMQNMIKQAQQMQQKVEEAQQRVDEAEVEASAGGGVVKVTASGSGKIKDIEIQEAVVDPDDVEMLQDLVIAAVNEALNKATELREAEMSKATGGMNLGGLL